MRRDSRDLTTLLGSMKGVKALINYIDKTGRLQQTKGEYPASYRTLTHMQSHRIMWQCNLTPHNFKPVTQGTSHKKNKVHNDDKTQDS